MRVLLVQPPIQDFYQTDIKNVFRILREVSGKNFAIDKDVSGKVTLTLDKPGQRQVLCGQTLSVDGGR